MVREVVMKMMKTLEDLRIWKQKVMIKNDEVYNIANNHYKDKRNENENVDDDTIICLTPGGGRKGISIGFQEILSGLKLDCK